MSGWILNFFFNHQNHMIERLWVEVNNRINYPIKSALVEMPQKSEIDMGNPMHQYCVSLLSINVANVGVSLFIDSWNNHPIPGEMHIIMKLLFCAQLFFSALELVIQTILLYCARHCVFTCVKCK